MKVLLLGGTGVIGTNLVQLLVANGVEIVITTRSSRHAGDMVSYVQGNAHDVNFLKTILLESWDVIIDFLVYSTESFKDRVDLLLKATKQYVFLSSARVYANSSLPITEESSRLLDVTRDTDYLSTDEYALAKAKQEDMLVNSKYGNWTIIRPYITYGEQRFQLGVLEKEEWLYRALQGRTIVFSREISSFRTTLTYGYNVAQGIESIIGERSALGEVFHITTDRQESKHWSDVLEIYLQVLESHLGFRPKVLLQDLDEFLGYRPNVSKYQIVYDRLFDRVFENDKVRQYIEVEGFVKPEVGLQICLESFLKNPHFKRINWRMEAKRDRATGEKTPLHQIPNLKQRVEYIFFRYFKF